VYDVETVSEESSAEDIPRRPLVIEPNGSAAADATKKRTGAMRIIVAHGGRLWCAKRTNLLMGAFMKYCRADAS